MADINNEQLVQLVLVQLVQLERLVRCLYWSDVCLRALRAKIRI